MAQQLLCYATAMLLLTTGVVNLAVADPYTIRVIQQDGSPVSGATIQGSHGLNKLPGRFTSATGEWQFDTADVKSPNPVLVVTHAALGLRMEPPELTVSAAQCPGRLCSFTAYTDGPATVAMEFSLQAGSTPLSLQAALWRGASPCPRAVDSDGYIIFGGTKRSACAATGDPASLYYRFVPQQPRGYSCTFTPQAGSTMDVCPSGNVYNAISYTCSAVVPAATTPLTYSVEVRTTRGVPLAGITFAGNAGLNSLSGMQTGYDGKWKFVPSQRGLSEGNVFTIVPYSSSYLFYPQYVELMRDAAPGNVYVFTAVGDPLGQALFKVKVTDSSDTPHSGVTVDAPGAYLCSPTSWQTTDAAGETIFPARKRAACSSDAVDPLNAYIAFNPRLAGFDFKDQADPPFQVCPSQLMTTRSVQSIAGRPDGGLRTISGRVFGPEGLPYPGVVIYDNGVPAATSRGDGSYSLFAQLNSANSLAPAADLYLFDPKQIGIAQLDTDYTDIDFTAVLLAPGVNPAPTPEPCPVKNEYRVSGTAFDADGLPLRNVRILNNHNDAAVTSSSGAYWFNVPVNSDSWITAEFQDQYLDPAGVSIPSIHCDTSSVDFRVTDAPSITLSGKTVTVDGVPLPDTQLVLGFGSGNGERRVMSDASGRFTLTLTQGNDYILHAARTGWVFAPVHYAEDAAFNDRTDRDFIGSVLVVDTCPDDPAKVNPGVCGCGVPDSDTDGDGFYDCKDQCPKDPLKAVPGQCGCGVPDNNTDGDGVLDCFDQCPLDPAKVLPGICGCGKSDADSDADTYPDCWDECPKDPAKHLRGQCGCGVSEVDSDRDGTMDCADLCPRDPLKQAPGMCGCGTSEGDADNDTAPDCIDLCPADPGKTAPGVCGCGKNDADSDGDGTPDCYDQCAADPAKVLPGLCGCGYPERLGDADGDGIMDCRDGCPNDRGKSAPGMCGCGVADDDRDQDSIADCNDGCASDPLKRAPGICGCGVSDIDTDHDGYPDCIDYCPRDAAKTLPGICGCGTSDADRDGDGAADCRDQCPDDPAKRAPGVCGCGIPDTDSDSDGLEDCIAATIPPPALLEPEGMQTANPPLFRWTKVEKALAYLLTVWDSSGAAVLDLPVSGEQFRPAIPLPVDRQYHWAVRTLASTGRSVYSSSKDFRFDRCPDDPLKETPGACGCGVTDVDRNGNGIIDCLETTCANPLTIDFEKLMLPAGTILHDQLLAEGISIDVVNNFGPNAALLFDSANPTGHDWDLGTPNHHFGGPGLGSGIGNDTPLGRVVIIAGNIDDTNHDGLADDPTDTPHGGRMYLTFAEPVRVSDLKLLDVQGANSGGFVSGLITGVPAFVQNIPGLGDNAVQTVLLDHDRLIDTLVLEFKHTGALAEIGFCAATDLCPTDPEKRFPGLCGCDREDRDDNHNGIIDCRENQPPTPTPTPRPDLRIRLTSVCSEDPQISLRWRVENPTSEDAAVLWDLLGSAQRGTLLVPSRSIAYFYTATVAGSDNIVRIFEGGDQIDAQQPSWDQCAAPPPPVPTPTLTPTPTPALGRLTLTSVCSDNPAATLRWRVTSSSTRAITAMWEVYGTAQRGELIVPALDQVYFSTMTVPNSSNTVRLLVDGVQTDVKAAGFTQCNAPAPTPTATPDPGTGNTILICHQSPNNPYTVLITESAWSAHRTHGDSLGACPIQGCSGAVRPLRSLPHLQGVRVGERTRSMTTFSRIASDSPALLQDINESESLNDVSSVDGEYYDLFISDSTGHADPQGSYITIQSNRNASRMFDTIGGNIDSLELAFTAGSDALVAADRVSRVELGNEVPEEEGGQAENALGPPNDAATRLSNSAASVTLGFCSLLGGELPRCMNGIDDDGDGLIDSEDPECRTPLEDGERGINTPPPTPQPTASFAPSPTPTKSPESSPSGTPSPTPTVPPTAAPTRTPTAAPTGSPTSTPTARPTASATSTPQPSPSVSPTSTPPPDEAPREWFLLQGALKGRNGRTLSAALRARLNTMPAGTLKVIAKNSDREQFQTELSDPYAWQLQVPAGKYRVALESNNQLEIISRPVLYRGVIVKAAQSGLHFAVRINASTIRAGARAIARRSAGTRFLSRTPQ